MRGTLKSKQRINWMFKNAERFSSTGFLALYSPYSEVEHGPEESKGRMAYVAGKRLGTAPLRSRAKRRLRAAAHEAHACSDYHDIVFVAKREVLKAGYPRLVSDMRRLTRILERNETSLKTGGDVAPTNEEDRDNTLCAEEAPPPAEKKQRGTWASIAGNFIVSIPQNIALLCINIYRHAISPLLPPSCRYVPTCSEYALIAFERFGFWRGLWLSVKRIGRCHPLAKGGYDPVPEEYGKKLA